MNVEPGNPVEDKQKPVSIPAEAFEKLKSLVLESSVAASRARAHLEDIGDTHLELYGRQTTVFERIFVVAGGVFAFSLTLVTGMHSATADGAHRASPFSRHALVVSWIFLLLSIFSTSIAWLLIQRKASNLHMGKALSQDIEALSMVEDAISPMCESFKAINASVQHQLFPEQIMTQMTAAFKTLIGKRTRQRNDLFQAGVNTSGITLWWAVSLSSLTLALICLVVFAINCANILLG